MELCPKESDAVIIGLNDLINTERYGIKLDYLFILDVLDEKPQVLAGQQNLGDTVRRINEMGIPFIAPYRYEEIPLSRAFPIREAVERFGMPYFSNTICYMICFALMSGAKEIHTFGINQASSAEYSIEKAGVEYWLGIANGMGVKVTIHGDKSELLRNKARWGHEMLYGYNASWEQMKRDEERFGEGVVKKLLAPAKQASRTVRKVN